jgi:hypothetical protein
MAVVSHQIEDIESVQTGHLDVEDEKIGTARDQRVHDQRTVGDDARRDVETVAQRLAQELGDVGVILSDEDVPHATSSARIRRKRRSLMQTLQTHMALWYAPAVPLAWSVL